MKIPLIKPYITEEIKEKVSEVLESRYLTEGNITKDFEDAFRNYIGSKHAIAVTSCTAGLEIALRCLNIGPGDEVIVPDYTYPATAAVAPIVGATSVIVDIDKSSMLIDYDAIEDSITKKTKAIIPVSIFGNPLDYNRLNQIKEKYNVYIIEDAACSIGAEFCNQKVGNHADISVFSLHPRKFITTGEGGMITTNNKPWADWLNSYKHFGMVMNNSKRTDIKFEIIGSNYKLSNILAAIGQVQMKYINELLQKRIELATNYIELLENNPNVRIPKTVIKGKHSYQSFCIFIENRDEIIEKMRDKGIEVQIGTYALHEHNAFQSNELVELRTPFERSKYASEHCLTLPLFHELTEKMQELIVETLNKLLLDSLRKLEMK